MTIATDAQVQAFVDSRLRPRCEALRNLIAQMNDDIAAIGDVYSNLTQQSPTWTDPRTDVPNQLTAANVLSINSALHVCVNAVTGDSSWPVVESACVRPLLG